MPQVAQAIWHGASEELLTRLKGRVNCLITDPPFGVDNQSNMAVTDHGKEYARKIANDETPEIAIATFKRVMDVLLPQMETESDAYIFTSYQVLREWLNMLDEYMPRFGFERSGVLIWQKDGPGMGDLDAAWGMAHEFIMYYKKGRRLRSDGVQRRSGVLHVPQVRPGDLIHPHEKPVELLEQFIKWSTDPGEFVLDPFGGSGSLARAARNVGRTCLCIEYDEKNYQLALQKFNAESGGLLD